MRRLYIKRSRILEKQDRADIGLVLLISLLSPCRSELLLQFLNHLEITSFQEIVEVGRLRVCKASKHSLIILKLTSSIPALLSIFSEKNSLFTLFIEKGLESIMTFTL